MKAPAPAAAAAILVLILSLTWLSVRAVNPQAEFFDGVLGELDGFATADAKLQRDVLRARAGVLRNYDPIAQTENALDASLRRLREIASDSAMTAAIDRLAASLDRQEQLVEQFKSDNALLQNSLAYFGLFSGRLITADGTGQPIPAVGALAAAMLHLTLDTSPDAANSVENRLDDLARAPSPPQDGETVNALLAHARLLHDLLPETDQVLKALWAGPLIRDLDALRGLVLAHQGASRTTARQYRILLYVTSLLLVGLLVHLGLQLRARSRALQRRAAFEHVLASVSMRFVNATPEDIDACIEQALGDMAECVGADRACFLMSGAPGRSYAWSRSGVAFPPGWPGHAPALAARFRPVMDRIVQVVDVNRLPSGAVREACAEFGLRGWACCSGVGKDGVDVTLGFDAVRQRSRITRPGELGLMRMALDAIVNAVDRQLLEREKKRLETRLQQARRLETVGTFASGVAHNFNNILGAIVGHAEIAQAQIALNSLPAHNLGEILLAAERARILIGQILTFGRRGDARRALTRVRDLVLETASLLRASLPPGVELAVAEISDAAVVTGESTQLQQVIFNLCANAAQAMDGAGRIEIGADVCEVASTLRLHRGDLAPGCYVRIAVSDAGRGMDDATLRQIFEPFFSTRAAGNGLGLATVDEIVRDHGGVMDVRSAPGAGSRFEVWLPCRAASAPVHARDLRPLPLGQGETVLVVDDEREQLLRDEDVLAALGYEPVGFSRADDALAACRQAPQRFDVLVVGRVAPATSAFALAAALHRIAPALPVLLATASADEIDAGALVAAGITDVVHWPIGAAEMAAALERCSGMIRAHTNA